MGICWYCHWGWSKPVADIYDAAVEKLGGDESVLHYGPSHAVWEDENWEDECVRACLDEESWALDYGGRFSEAQLAVCKWSLEELLKVPEEVRDPEPEDYDEEHPENYPPLKDLEMVRR